MHKHREAGRDAGRQEIRRTTHTMVLLFPLHCTKLSTHLKVAPSPLITPTLLCHFSSCPEPYSLLSTMYLLSVYPLLTGHFDELAQLIA
jgi:hypothetical protein